MSLKSILFAGATAFTLLAGAVPVNASPYYSCNDGRCYDDQAEDGTRRSLSVWLEILSEIALGEQMTIDYASPADEAIPCLCGAASCRGWIVAEEALGEVVAARHGLLVTN